MGWFPKSKHPYENLLVKNLKGEIWKDVQDHEGYYQVSNLGRVKSLDRIIPHRRLYQQFVKGRILKPKIVKDFNKLTGDAMISLQVSFTVEGVTHHHNIRRLVFAAFKKKIDFEKDGMYVINIDGDGYNNRVSNLKLVSKSEKQRRSIDNGRQDFEYLKIVDRSAWQKNYSRRIAINQFSRHMTQPGLIQKGLAMLPKGCMVAFGGDLNGTSLKQKDSLQNDNF